MANPPEEILRDRTRLQGWMDDNPTVNVEARNANLAGVDLSDLSLRDADFTDAVLEKASFRQSDLATAKFTRARLESADLERVTLTGANLGGARLDGAKLDHGHWQGARCDGIFLDGAVAQNCDFQRCNLEHSHLEGADLKGANLSMANLLGANFLKCDLRGANLYGANVTNTAWRRAKIDAATRFSATVWGEAHDPPNDGADQLQLGWWPGFLSWATIRFVGRLPLFSGSYLLLTFALSVATGINWLNQTQVVQSLTYPVSMPPRVIALLLGSTLLAIGSTVFELACPARVKEYSRTQWIEELRRPGMLYVSDSLQRRSAAVFALVFVFLGGIAVGAIFIERVFRALVIAAGAIP